jgi:hypothetical protein
VPICIVAVADQVVSELNKVQFDNTPISPYLLTLWHLVDFTLFGTFLLTAAAEAIFQPWRFAVISVISSNVAAVTASMRLHITRARHGTCVTSRSHLGTTAQQTASKHVARSLLQR